MEASYLEFYNELDERDPNDLISYELPFELQERFISAFGGFKKSGIGRKLGLEESIAEFTQSKTIRTAIMSATNGDLERLYS